MVFKHFLCNYRCGLAAEVTWALDVLNILLFDDQTVVYFGLHHMPGLLEALIEHLRRGLINMFDICSELELGSDEKATGANKRVKVNCILSFFCALFLICNISYDKTMYTYKYVHAHTHTHCVCMYVFIFILSVTQFCKVCKC